MILSGGVDLLRVPVLFVIVVFGTCSTLTTGFSYRRRSRTRRGGWGGHDLDNQSLYSRAVCRWVRRLTAWCYVCRRPGMTWRNGICDMKEQKSRQAKTKVTRFEPAGRGTHGYQRPHPVKSGPADRKNFRRRRCRQHRTRQQFRNQQWPGTDSWERDQCQISRNNLCWRLSTTCLQPTTFNYPRLQSYMIHLWLSILRKSYFSS